MGWTRMMLKPKRKLRRKNMLLIPKGSLSDQVKVSISIPQRCSEESNPESVSNVHKLLCARYAALGPLSSKELQVKLFPDILMVKHCCIAIAAKKSLVKIWVILTESEDKFTSSFNFQVSGLFLLLVILWLTRWDLLWSCGERKFGLQGSRFCGRLGRLASQGGGRCDPCTFGKNTINARHISYDDI